MPFITAQPQAGSTVHLLGNLLTFRATAATTEGELSLIDTVTAPGQGSPPHLQRDDVEAFYVLEGRYEFTLGDTTAEQGPGAFLFVPRGLPHQFRNPGTEPARMLIINVPGGLHERFFLEAGDPVPAAKASAFPAMSPPDVPRLLAAASRYGIEVLLPA
ncbi:cupin domain-containing protein [Roseomonas sp. BN140053]|uniref:cupin domain-containing protein n=1 Tax=Roseomonas sp. BN140053 TaxID=3391898 RepID=UPI0039EB6A30